MRTIGLRLLNKNPSKVVAEVRASGAPVVITDRGKPVARLVPEEHQPSSILQELLDKGEVIPPVRHGMPDLIPPGLIPDDVSLSDLVIADRNKERHR
jgi:prevent-host-death family protein